MIRRIRKAVDYYGLTAEELGFGPGAHGKSTVRKAGKRVAIKYRDGAGNQWSGRGRRPAWLVAALEAGRTLSEFEIRKAPSA